MLWSFMKGLRLVLVLIIVSQCTLSRAAVELTGEVSTVITTGYQTNPNNSTSDAGVLANSPATAGVTWIQETAAAAFSPRQGHTTVGFNDKLWLIGGQGDSGCTNDVWSSSDGSNWTLETAATAFSPRAHHTSVIFNSKLWVIAGLGNSSYTNNDIWSSSDGINWTQETAAAAFAPRNDHTSVIFNGKLWVIAGYSNSGWVNDVWSSSDGVNWTQRTAAAAFTPRSGHTSVVFNGKLWVIGGYSPMSGDLNDAWSSSDGVTWTQEIGATAFTPRSGHTCVVFNNRFWVIGGHDHSSIFNDVWSSNDGVNWTQETAAAGFTPRLEHASVAFNDKLWVIAGHDASSNFNDVWSYGVILHVDGQDGNDANDGLSWATAKKTIQSGVDVAAQEFGQVWVRMGIYPETVTMRSGVALYGGFAGGETTLSHRDVAVNPTVIDASTANAGGPAAHVVSMQTLQNARIDGFTITGATEFLDQGGGIYCTGLDNTNTIENCTIMGNAAINGGGIACLNSAPHILHCTLSGNTGESFGGGIYVEGTGTPGIEQCLIRGNTTTSELGNRQGGGGIACINGQASITDCTIIGNYGLFAGGGIFCQGGQSQIVRCQISDNLAEQDGGGIHCDGTATLITQCQIGRNVSHGEGGGVSSWNSPSPTICRNLICGNFSSGNGGGIHVLQSAPRIQNSILNGNVAGSRGGGIACPARSNPVVINCTISDNFAAGGGGGIWAHGNTVQLQNCIFSNNFKYAIMESAAFTLLNCLFHDNTDGDYFSEISGEVLTGAAAINALPGNSGNVDGDPMLAWAPSGAWTADPIYDPQTHLTTLTDSALNYPAGSLAGRAITPGPTPEGQQAIIVNNGPQTIVVAGDLTGIVFAGSTYQLHNYRLEYGSAALDTGLGAGAPAFDFDGNCRPVDIPGVGTDGPRQGFDIGAYEAQINRLYELQPVGQAATAGNSANNVFVRGTLAYVTDYRGGLSIFDVSDPASPGLRGTWTSGDDWCMDLVLSGNLAYIANGYRGLAILDVSNPAAPTLVGNLQTGGFAHGIGLDGHYVYLADGWSGLKVIDVSNPAAPTLTGHYQTQGWASGLIGANGKAYIASIRNDGMPYAGLEIIDVANPAAPAALGNYPTPDQCHDLWLEGDRAYLGCNTSGVLVVDVSNPAAPTLAGSVNIPGQAYDTNVNQGWIFAGAFEGGGLVAIDARTPGEFKLAAHVGTTPTFFSGLGVFTANGLIYMADGTRGLRIFRLIPGTPSNQPPVALDDSAVTNASTAVTIDVLANDTDPDGDALTVTDVTQGLHGTVAINPDNSVTYIPEAGWSGQDSFAYGISDGHCGIAVAGVLVTVQSVNGAPTLGPITAPVNPLSVGTLVEASATFTDPNAGDTHTASWDWGDDSTSAGTVDEASGLVTGSHVYTQPGVYRLTLTVQDQAGATATAVFEYVVIYDPSGGFVTGGGWIESPAGAYRPDPSLSGKANFGFVSRYKKGASTPSGNTEFQFKAGNLNFHSSAYQWLTVAGVKAMYKGEGTINGSGKYGFILSAIDGNLLGQGKPDMFRIKIWEIDGAVIYDNQNNGEYEDPTTSIAGGSIVIHH